MTKPELGTKRLCAGCNAKFYDLLKSPIVCPMCEAVFVVPKPTAVAAAARLRADCPGGAGGGCAGDCSEERRAPATGENADGEKEAEGGVALLEIDED